MEDIKQYFGRLSVFALVIFIMGRVLHQSTMSWIGTGLMTLYSILTIIVWKDNNSLSNFIGVTFLILIAASFIDI